MKDPASAKSERPSQGRAKFLQESESRRNKRVEGVKGAGSAKKGISNQI